MGLGAERFPSWSAFCRWAGKTYEGRYDVQILTPWIDTSCPHRLRGRQVTEELWRELGFEQVYGRGASRAEARNDAIRKSTADVIVCADADTYTTKGQVWAAVHIAAQTGNLTSAFDVILRQAEGADLWQECGDRFKNPPNGIVAISRPALDVVGGFDERFYGWGGEDQAFLYSCEALLGPVRRVPGFAWHVWHPPGRDTEPYMPGECRRLFERYKVAGGWVATASGRLRRIGRRVPSASTIRAILSEPGAPLHGRN